MTEASSLAPATATLPAPGDDLWQNAKAWPFEEARKLVKRLETQKDRPADAPVIFETGYGPSGLPHIGTFGEVMRTTMVRHAFTCLTGRPTRLICFSDDMDGMRKVPGNIPQAEMMAEHIGKPLTAVPDPFGTHPSFGAHNNARLQAFLDDFGFDYEFFSATDCYRSGRFDDVLLKALAAYDQIMDVMLPTLGPERQATYSPFLPISPTTGRVLYVPMKAVDAGAGTITFEDEHGSDATIPVTGGNAKLQWKPDFGMRWAALGIDFEMFGKDHQTNAPIYSRICKILGKEPPVQYVYELFLDENGQKISKTTGNGLTIEEWLTYATPESLSLFMFQNPRKAKRLYFDIIPKTVDEYFQHLDKYDALEPAKQVESPAFHIHRGAPAKDTPPVSFALLLNLVGAANTDDPAALWGFITQYAPEASPANNPALDQLVGYAIRYFKDFVAPTRAFRAADEREEKAMLSLVEELEKAPADADAEALQSVVYAVGMAHNFDPLRNWFKALYEVLLGVSQGPRMGSFISLYGREAFIARVHEALAGKLATDLSLVD
ncbi:MAG: lysine--tRNA ligase [Pseudomonadota bacterium]